MVYPYMNGSLVGQDLGQILVYSNSITSHLTSTFIIFGFFFIVFLSSMLWSQRISGRIRLELHAAAASFVTLGFTVILSTIKNFVSTIDLLVVIGLTIGSIIWIFISNPTENY